MATPVLILAKSGMGKGQPKTDIIPTPNGDMVFGDLSVGDEVFGSNGKAVKVTAVYDRGVIPTYEVLFSDGSKKIVDGEHIWTLEQRVKDKTRTKDIRTKDLEGVALINYYLPMTAVEYSEKELWIDPYLLGLWIADGSLHHNNVRITKKDHNIVDYLKTKASNWKEYDGIYQFNFLPDNIHLNRELLNRYGFDDLTRSRQKNIPIEYLLSSIKQRRALLKGLMDGDGSKTHTDREAPQALLYSTTSHSLAKSIHRLITSLGIVAHDRHIVDKREGKTDYYQVSYNEYSRFNKRSIKTVTRMPDQDIQCIEVDDPRKLYVCDTYNHLLTHNSSSMRNFKHDEIALINVLGKPLPFETKFDSTLETADPETIKQAMLKTEKRTIIIDDYGYVLTTMLMNQYGKGNNFDLYANIGRVSWELTEWIRSHLPKDKIVYMLMHEEYTDDGGVKPKTVGKMTDEKICLEGIFTIVLRGYFQDGKYGFLTQKQTFEDCIKVPMGLFKEKFIDNDLSMVDQRIREFYKMPALEATNHNGIKEDK